MGVPYKQPCIRLARFLKNAIFRKHIVLGFQYYTGLLVNVLTLAGFVLGIIQLKPGFGPFSEPGPVVVLLYVFMALVWLLVGVWLLRLIKNRNRVGVSRRLPATDGWKASFVALMYVVTTPTTILWILAWGQLLGWPDAGIKGADGAATLFVVGFFTLIGAGEVVGELTITIDWMFNLDHYTEQP
ncbi:MAG: hypothetical protein JSR78_08495 [Proteobacteria bacterium]|nr:hypothetical protein [Pseudomonadota bacterium]